MTGYKVPKSTVEHLRRRMLDIGSAHTLEKRHYASGLQEAIHAIEESPKEELDSPWHTGEPTEGGMYLVVTDIGYDVWEFNEDFQAWHLYFDNVKAWRKIEPYKEEA